MEHIDEILASDLLERYVLGDVTQDEKIKVDLLRINHREIREALSKLEIAIEKLAIDNAISAPASVRETIIKNISGEDSSYKEMPEKNININYPWLKMASALLAGVLLTGLIMQQKINQNNIQLENQAAELAILQRDCDQLSQQYAMINHTNTLPILLKGSASFESSRVVVYWNQSLQKSLLRVVELPSISNDQIYQLWADVDGEMLDLGTFEAGAAIVDAIPMGYLDNATSLNITVEPEGGSDHPTLSTLTASQII